ncbi:DUF2065 domain-containing protein [Oricola sp.]|uniref:DUF2065 domain-containing protein n=1 Tax=Oricola sp. TaxID=1979950 RepID=UPI003BAB543E
MELFLTALGLAIIIEGFFYGGFPAIAKQLAAMVSQMPDEALRSGGLAAGLLGLILVWIGQSVF